MSEESSRQRKKAYEVVEGRRIRSVENDPVEDEMLAEERELAREARRLRLEEIVAKRRKKVEEANREGAGGVAQGDPFVKSLIVDKKAQEQWLSLDDDQRNTILAAITASKAGEQGMGLTLPLMMMQMRQNPTSNVKDMVDLIKAVAGDRRDDSTTELLKIFIPLIQEKKPEASATSIFKDAVNLVQMLTAKDREYLMRELERERSQPSLGEQLRGVLDTAETMGYKRGGSDLEVEKMRIEHDRWKTEQEWNREQWRDEVVLRRQDAQDRMEMIKEFAGKFLDRAGPVIDATFERGEKVVRGPSGTPQANPPVATSPSTQEPAKKIFEMPCEKCGTKMAVEGPPFPSEVKCPSCGAVHSQKSASEA